MNMVSSPRSGSAESEFPRSRTAWLRECCLPSVVQAVRLLRWGVGGGGGGDCIPPLLECELFFYYSGREAHSWKDTLTVFRVITLLERVTPSVDDGPKILAFDILSKWG